MKLIPWRSCVIMFKTAWNTIIYSIKIFALARNPQTTRQQFNQIIQRWASCLLGIVKVKVTVENPFQVTVPSNRAVILMSNHQSHYDIPLMYEIFPDISLRMIAKKELFRIPFFGRAMRAVETIAIDRQNRQQAMEDLAQAKIKMEQGLAIWISPEGTRSRTGDLLPFKKGGFMLALQTEAVIIPIAIDGAGAILPAKTWEFQLNRQVTMRIGTPIDTRHYIASERDKLMQQTQTSIADMLASLRQDKIA